jgi:hypothetical protein
MTTMLCAVWLAALAGGHKDAAKAPADPNAELAKAHGGKVWVQTGPLPAVSGAELGSWLSGHPATTEIPRKGKDGPWSISYVAIFRKAAAKGPMTVQFVDKDDPKNIIDQYSPPNEAATLIFQSTFELDPDRGFNKTHTYLIRVGQIIKTKFVSYATGEMKLR